MAGAAEQILELKQLGYHIVLVTGALDFQIEPLARELDAGTKQSLFPSSGNSSVLISFTDLKMRKPVGEFPLFKCKTAPS